MENAGYVGLAYQVVLKRKMDLIANNIANMDTTGYKSQHPRFKEHISETDPDSPLAMVENNTEYKNFKTGNLISTGNQLDIALAGNGFLAVRSPDGADYVTRNGRLQVNNANQLSTSSGELVLNQGGQAITVPDGETTLNITKDGIISGKQGQIDQLKIVSLADPQSLQQMGNSLFKTNGQEAPDAQTEIQQGYLEGSNVNPIAEMTSMMDVQRAYESMARMLQSDHDRQNNAIRKLAETR